MDIDDLSERLGKAAALNPPLGYKVLFDLGEAGVIWWDGTESPAEISRTAQGEADTTLRISAENAEKLLAGELDPTMAFMMGKLKVEGSMGVAMKVASLLGD
jgi:putative sterol carrier protein